MTPVKNWLLLNGFKEMEKNSYANDFCNVVINEEDECYEMADADGNVMYSPNLNIYWLVGILTWHDYIPRNYRKEQP